MDPNEKARSVQLSSVVFGTLDSNQNAEELSRLAYHSRSGFFRLFQALIRESPAAMRRRILLERAAWQLRDSRLSATEIAFEANYGSLEAFTRAFRRAFGVSPSIYRRTAVKWIHLPAKNDFHFRPPDSHHKGAYTNMDLFDLFAGTEAWYTRRLLEQAGRLTQEQLDQPLNSTAKVFGWDKPDQNLREILERMVITKEVWTAALTGGAVPEIENRPAEQRTPAALLDRFNRAEQDFQKTLCSVRDRGAWDETFVDALCEPPESFTFGGTFAHIVTFNAHRRLNALDAFHKLGIALNGIGCPMEYEASVRESRAKKD